MLELFIDIVTRVCLDYFHEMVVYKNAMVVWDLVLHRSNVYPTILYAICHDRHVFR